MEAFQIARNQDNILITIDASRINADLLMQTLRKIQVEYLAQTVNFDDSILKLAKEIDRDWWQKNKKRLLGKDYEKGRA